MCLGERGGRSAEREFVSLILTSRDTELWPANKMLKIKISLSSHLVGVCQLKKGFDLLSRQVNIWILRLEISLG